MKYRLLVLDIDGTVTNSSKEIMEQTKQSLIRIQERGCKVVLASGRPPKGVYSIAEELQFDRFHSYILANNGAIGIEFCTRRCLFERHLPRHLPARLCADAKSLGLGFAVYHGDSLVAGTRLDDTMLAETRTCGMRLEYQESFGKYLDFPVSECLFTGSAQDLEVVEPELKHRYYHEAQIFHSEPQYLEVIPKNVDKAYGLKHLLTILGIQREEMVYCGDSYNDMRMIQYAGLGVAMANAPDPVKMIADYVTERDNDHDGIAEVVKRFF